MSFLVYVSDYIIPILIFYVVCYGMVTHSNVFDDFCEGAKEGFDVVRGILPTLIGLMVAVGYLRASGSLEILSDIIRPVADIFGFPTELVPLVTVKMFSSSAATSLLLDIYKEFGTDSYIGILASVLMSSSETIFYTMSVYFGVAKVRKTRYTLAGALVATLGGIIGSIMVCRIL